MTFSSLRRESSTRKGRKGEGNFSLRICSRFEVSKYIFNLFLLTNSPVDILTLYIIIPCKRTLSVKETLGLCDVTSSCANFRFSSHAHIRNPFLQLSSIDVVIPNIDPDVSSAYFQSLYQAMRSLTTLLSCGPLLIFLSFFSCKRLPRYFNDLHTKPLKRNS